MGEALTCLLSDDRTETQNTGRASGTQLIRYLCHPAGRWKDMPSKNWMTYRPFQTCFYSSTRSREIILIRNANVRQMAEFVVVVQAVADDELIGDLETVEIRNQINGRAIALPE